MSETPFISTDTDERRQRSSENRRADLRSIVRDIQEAFDRSTVTRLAIGPNSVASPHDRGQAMTWISTAPIGEVILALPDVLLLTISDFPQFGEIAEALVARIAESGQAFTSNDVTPLSSLHRNAISGWLTWLTTQTSLSHAHVGEAYEVLIGS